MNCPRNFRRDIVSGIAMVAVCLCAQLAHAEKADRSKDVEVLYDKLLSDFSQNTAVVEGNVVLTQGTLKITAARMKIKRDEGDNVFAEIFGVPGQQVSFREKREGQADFMEGWADRAEFDQRANTVKLFTKASVKSGNDQLFGEYIFYNTETEKFEVSGRALSSQPGAGSGEGDRGRLVFKPRTDEAKAAQKK